MPPIEHGHDSPIGTYNELRTISQAVNRKIRELNKLSIAAINGYAIQTGLSLALACDFKVFVWQLFDCRYGRIALGIAL